MESEPVATHLIFDVAFNRIDPGIKARLNAVFEYRCFVCKPIKNGDGPHRRRSRLDAIALPKNQPHTVALALQGTLTNFFAGLNILTDGSIRIGDFVELDGGMSGYVDQIGWRTTRIRMLANNMVIIPNTKLADSIATNYNYPEDQMSVYLEVGVSYASDLDHVERVTVEVAKQVMDETVAWYQKYLPAKG